MFLRAWTIKLEKNESDNNNYVEYYTEQWSKLFLHAVFIILVNLTVSNAMSFSV